MPNNKPQHPGIRTWRHLPAIGLFAACCCLVLVDISGWTNLLIPVAQADEIEDFEVVDCLVPGKLRRLGSMTYVSRRRPIKTTAKSCQIKGGEYVLDDPANYRSALRIWEAAANSGEAEAQYYLGEIYEKGLAAGKPDYLMAAAWYRKAADQNFKRAAVNLGRLYEKGLGVAKNDAEAFRWYQQAAGLKKASLSLLLNEGSAGQLKTLSGTLKQREREITRLKQELERVTRELSQLQPQLERSREKADEIRINRDQTKQEIEVRRLQLLAVENREARGKLKQMLSDQENALAKSNEDITNLRAELATLYGESARRQQEISRLSKGVAQGQLELRSQLETKQQEIQALEQRLDERTAKLAGARDQLRSDETLASNFRGRVTELNNLLAKSDPSGDVARYKRELQRLDSQLNAQESRLSRRDAEISRLKDTIKRLETEASKRQQNLASPDPRTIPAGAGLEGPIIELIDPPLIVRGGMLRLAIPTDGKREISGRVIAPSGLSSLTINGKQVPTSTDGVFKTQLPKFRSLTDDFTLELRAADRQNKQAIVRLLVTSASAATSRPFKPLKVRHSDFGRYFALVIGNDNYTKWEKLDNAVNDARAVASLLKTRYGYEVTPLYNANRQQILRTLNGLRKKLTEKDNLLIYYAGHGHLEKQLDRGYWIPVDARLDDPTDWIPTYSITDQLKIMSAKHVLVVADSCYAGKLTRSSLARLKPGISEGSRLRLLRTFAKKHVRTALTSGGVQPVLDSGGSGHSVFTKAFLDVLNENALVLETERLFLAIRSRVADAASNLNTEQIPTYEPIHLAGHETGDFVFVPL